MTTNKISDVFKASKTYRMVPVRLLGTVNAMLKVLDGTGIRPGAAWRRCMDCDDYMVSERPGEFGGRQVVTRLIIHNMGRYGVTPEAAVELQVFYIRQVAWFMICFEPGKYLESKENQLLDVLSGAEITGVDHLKYGRTVKVKEE